MSSTPTTFSSPALTGAPQATARRARWPKWFGYTLLLALLGGGGWFTANGLLSADDAGDKKPDLPNNAKIGSPLFTVKSGPLTISVDEGGTIRAAEAEVLKNEVEGSTTILSIVPEGKFVKEGDLLIELDSSELQERKIDQEIKVQNSHSALVQAKENLEVQKKQAEADATAAQVDLDLAKLDLQKYLEGEYKQKVLEAQGKIDLAEAELKRAEEKAGWSRKLYGEKYISKTELDSDELSLKKAAQDVKLATSQLDLLERFTHKRTMTELKTAVSQKEFLLTKTRHKGQSNIIDAEASLQAKQVQYEREVEKLEKYKEQLVKTKIYAPLDGMVVYATSISQGRRRSSSQEPLEEGTQVRERQELIRLPTANKRAADIKVHESSLKKVRQGLPVEVTTEALPGKVFHGYVEKIALLPDTGSSWLNPHLKVYNTEIHIEKAPEDLRPGMSCRARIIVEHHKKAMFVPVQAVLRVDGKPTVYVPGPNGPVPRNVEIGLDNTRMVHIKSGLKDGDQVLLNPPLPPSRVQRFDQPTDGDVRSPRPAADRGPASGDARPRGENPQGAGAGGQRKFDPSKLTPEQRKKYMERMKKRQEQGGGQRPRGDSE